MMLSVPGHAQSNCGMQLNDTAVIFCDTFSQAHPVTNRSGQLDPVVWGVSRLAGSGDQWATGTIDGCNGSQPSSGVGATDVIVCGGQLRESVNDDGNVTVLAMYPKQPFDFAGRTGTISFDLTNDTTGAHGAWPEIWITDQPVPAPFFHTQCAFCSLPRHAVGISLAADRGWDAPDGWKVDRVIAVRNYVPEDKHIWYPWEPPTTGMQVLPTSDFATLSSGANSPMNHVEIRISQNHIEVFASDAGSTTLKKIIVVENANLSFTRGLVWLQDAHYHAHKAHIQNPAVPDQRIHTYSWDNFAFDGPATYRDLSFDVLANSTSAGFGEFPEERYHLGWSTSPSSPAVLNTLPMTTANVTAATGAALMFNYGIAEDHRVFTYVLNGHSHTVNNPVPAGQVGWRSVSLPINKADLVAGPQSITLSSAAPMWVSNVNIVLVAAASVPGVDPPDEPTCTQPIFTQVVGQTYHLGTCTDAAGTHQMVIP